MRRPRRLALATLVASSLSLTFAAGLQATAPAEGVHVGAAITVEQPTPIAAILAAPDQHAGKVVRVEGEVSGVCTKAGCWMDFADPDGRRLRIQVEDGVLVFPPDAAGRHAVAQGTVTIEELSREQLIGWRRHLAAEGGEPFDEASVGDGPFRLVQVAGSGATIGE